ncbi:unnamed protein product, partial [Enterobius vermicularis]|uniref:Mago-bind domain-containing protein n=1 Tax=Enterobius vermicularis TaxID=51028 RepID=A0A0N4UUB8_ENTVE
MSLNAYICVEFLPEANAEELSRKKEVRFPKPVTTRRVVGYRDQKQIDTRRQKRRKDVFDYDEDATLKLILLDGLPTTTEPVIKKTETTTQPKDIGDVGGKKAKAGSADVSNPTKTGSAGASNSTKAGSAGVSNPNYAY